MGPVLKMGYYIHKYKKVNGMLAFWGLETI